jgi:DNA polymerase-3 subunit alpha
MAAVAYELTAMGVLPITRLQDNPKVQTIGMVAGYVVAVRHIVTKKGKRIAFLTLEDIDGRIDIGVFGDLYTEVQALLVKNALLVVIGEVDADTYSGGYKINANQLYTLDQARAIYAQALELTLSEPRCTADTTLITRLQETLKPHTPQGQCPVIIHYHHADYQGQYALGEQWHIQINQALLDELDKLLEGNHVINYVS